MILHRIGRIAVRPQLIAGHIACGSCKETEYPVYDGSAGVLYGSGLDNVELGIGLAAYPPVTHIAVLRAVYLPMVSSSMMMPCMVSMVTTADMPMQLPALMVLPRVELYTS